MTVKKSHKPRAQLTRRRLNDAWYGFGDPEGNFSWSKFIAVWAQIAALFHFGANFDLLISKPESLGLLLAFIIMPETFKKFITMKYGGQSDYAGTAQSGHAARRV